MKSAYRIGFSGEVYLDTLPEGKKAIGTHNGAFHSDETLAVSLLRSLPEFRDHGLNFNVSSLVVIVRTRDMNILSKCDIVVDVGAEYVPQMLECEMCLI